MIGEKELVEMIDRLEADALQRWIDHSVRFDELDVARVRLICELHYELRIEEDSMSVVLSLMDQLYQARRSLRTLLSALEAEPEEVRARIATHLESGEANASLSTTSGLDENRR